MARAIILKFIFVKSLATPPPELLEQCKAKWSADDWNKFLDKVRDRNAQQIEKLHQNGLWNAVEDEECVFMQAGPAEIPRQKLIDANWLAE